MTPVALTALLSVATVVSPLSAAIMGVLFYQQRKKLGDLEIIQGEKKVELDEATRNDLIQQAAHRDEKRDEERARWWQEQIDALRSDLVEEQVARRKLTAWAYQHQPWDARAWHKALESDPEFPPPPTLEH